VHWVYTYEESNWPLHEQIRDIEEGDIVICQGFDCHGRALFGDLVSKYILLYQQASAIVARGMLRDAHRLVKEQWPIWCEGYNPEGCFNVRPRFQLDPLIIAEGKENYHGAIAVCDDTGVVVIPKEHHTLEFLDKLKAIEEMEDIWYECIDRRKWSTFDTVCLKKYLLP